MPKRVGREKVSPRVLRHADFDRSERCRSNRVWAKRSIKYAFDSWVPESDSRISPSRDSVRRPASLASRRK